MKVDDDTFSRHHYFPNQKVPFSQLFLLWFPNYRLPKEDLHFSIHLFLTKYLVKYYISSKFKIICII